jgi:hypothetical protein
MRIRWSNCWMTMTHSERKIVWLSYILRLNLWMRNHYMSNANPSNLKEKRFMKRGYRSSHESRIGPTMKSTAMTQFKEQCLHKDNGVNACIAKNHKPSNWHQNLRKRFSGRKLKTSPSLMRSHLKPSRGIDRLNPIATRWDSLQNWRAQLYLHNPSIT